MSEEPNFELPACDDLSDEVTWLPGVTYADRGFARAHGAKFDGQRKQWFVPPNVDRSVLRQYMRPRIYLTCTYEEREQAREAGAQWDSCQRAWYILDGVDTTPYQQWLALAPLA